MSKEGQFQISSVKMSEEGERVPCDVCTEMFPTISKAITHKHKVHPDHDAKYFCPWCGKLFTMKHLHNKHIASTHSDKEGSEETGFHCDYCDVNFFVPSAMLYHNKFFHRQDTELAAIGQSRKLKIFNQQPLPIYYCPFCGEEYFNKVNLHKHMSDDHSDENQSPDDVLRCPLCDAIFYHLDAYEVHLTFHSSEDIYSEENELLKEVTEFSLETTPPIMEKVENDTAYDAEQSVNTIGIESLLQQAMNESADNDNSNPIPEKRKKHKKHKKSKKSSITLDEFLNMNKDVFGEGIDVEGIEEVPTQVVAKHLKKPTKLKARARATQPPSDIEKLKRQGIVIKKKTGAGAIPLKFSKELLKTPMNAKQNLKIARIKATAEAKTDNVSTNEVLSKLFNQGNSQLKIVKKSTAEALNKETKEFNDESSKEIGTMSHTEEVNQAVEDRESCKAMPETVDPAKDSTKDYKSDNDSNHSDMSTNGDQEHRNENEDLTSQKAIQNGENENVSFENKSNICKNVDFNLTSSNNTQNVTNNICVNNTMKSKNEDEVRNKSADQHQSANSLNVLKHLSHLVVKSVSKKTEVQNYPQSHNSDDKDFCENKKKDDQDQKNDTIKKLSQNLTIKTINLFKNTPQNMSSNVKSNEISDKDEVNVETQLSNAEENIDKKSLKINTNVQLRSPDLTSSPAHSPGKVIRSPPIKEHKQSEQTVKQIQQTQQQKFQTANLLRKLPNITAKSVNMSKTIEHATNSAKTTNQALNEMKETNQKLSDLEERISEKEIEIFNIDDSDDEEVHSKDNSKLSPKPIKEEISEMLSTSTKPNVSPTQNAQNNSENILKNISKHITIKPKSVPLTPKIVESAPTKCTRNDMPTPNKTKIIESQNEVLQNTLKNLSKNIIVKSNNSQISERPPSRHSLLNKDYDSDSDNNTCRKKLSITECDNDEFSDKEFDSDNKNQAIVEYPDEDNSENDNDSLLDIEREIKTSKLVKPVCKKTLGTYNSKINEDVLNKSNNFETDDDDQFEEESESYNIPHINNELSIKPFKPTKLYHTDNTATRTNFKEVTQNVGNQKLDERTSSSNQVTQEVTMKTIQSKTVVQEITTTVTKTIRTVNQTVKQDMRSLSQGFTSPSLPTRPQKIQGVRPQQIRNFPGTAIRQSTPVQVPRIRNVTPQVRPTVRTPVRPCNQLVPVRSGANIIRPNAPRNPSATVRKPGPKCSQKQPATGQPLKISPNAVVSTTKRPSEEASGPFSCFKKQKESLIPVPEFSHLDSDQEGDSSVQYAASHISKSNFMSSTSSVKGNKVVTTNQMKSEMSACSQLKKLSNVSGLKIMKTSQTKQITQVEESNENSAKRSALEAIEKLQKQGLLLKKPIHEEELNNEHYTDSEDEHMDECL